MSDSYLTIQTEKRSELKVKGSRFIGESYHVETEDEALNRLEAVRKRKHQATHHCYAYLVGRPEVRQFKYSDDGEPTGTAGKPIYDVLTGRRVTDVLLVVTRYFGGTKLGTGGLVRAYGNTARAVMEASGSREVYITSQFRFVLDFSLYDQWQREIHKLGARIIDSQFSDRVTLDVGVRRTLAERLVSSFQQLTSGKGEVEEIDKS